MPVVRAVTQLLDRCLPAGLSREHGGPEHFRARTLLAFLATMSMVGVCYLPVTFLGTQSGKLQSMTVLACLVNFILLGVFYRTHSVRLVTHLFAATLLAELGYSATMMGGLNASGLMWTMLVPLVVTLLAGFWAGLAWTGMSAGLITVFFLLHQNGIVFPRELNDREAAVVRFVALVALPSLVVVLCLCYERLRIMAERDATQERELVRTVLDASEVDRRLFAFEIHDGVVPLLTGAAMRLDGAINQAPEGERTQQLSEIRELIGRAIVEARQIMSGLRPPVLDEMGVVAGIDFLASDYQQRHGLNVSAAVGPDVSRFSPAVENALFRICQEALTNVVKHSGATECHISLRRKDHAIELTVGDTGRGFEPGVEGANRVGLRGIRERARLLGGDSEILSAAGQGTLIRVTLPHEPNDSDASGGPG